MNNNLYFTGGMPDDRKEEEKLKDYTHEELIGYGAPVIWEERAAKGYTIRNQNGSGACGAFAASVALGRNEERENSKYVNVSPAFIYQKRKNKDSMGMYILDIMDILKKYGSPLDENLSDDNKGDGYMDTKQFSGYQIEEAENYKIKNYLFMTKNIDEVASVISQGRTPILLLRCGIAEWSTTPKLIKNTKEINHYVPCVDFILIDGVKHIVVQDSWGWSGGMNGLRFISEEFLMERVETISYTIDLENAPKSDEPKYTFKNVLEFGMRGSKDVVALQDILKYEGCLDKAVPSTGNYFNMTALAVKKLQLKNKIAGIAEIESLQGKRVGSKTLAYLAKYS